MTKDSEAFGIENTCVRQRKRKADDTASWKRNDAKVRREKGKHYLGYRYGGTTTKKLIQDVPKEMRKMGPPCRSKECNRRRLHQCSKITENQRQAIFDQFWHEASWDQKKMFVLNNVDVVEKKSGTIDAISRRENTFVYHLRVTGERYRVCQKLFLSTVALSSFTVRSWVTKNGRTRLNDRRIKPSDQTTTEANIKFVKDFFERLPKLPSHYNRETSPKKFLDPIFRTKMDVFNIYTEECRKEHKKPLSRCLFSNMFDDSDLSIHKLKRDQCDRCLKYETGQMSQQDYNIHIQSKDRARAEKSVDQKRAKNGECMVFTMDVQAVKVAPFLKASAAFFRTKMCCHNFTMFNLANNKTMCYWFDESASDFTSSSFATCIIDYLSKHVPSVVPIILYSDGCTYQNRNVNLSNALAAFCVENNVEIQQKFLIAGHTQTECDSVHARIESKLRNREIYIPFDYVRITKEARQHPLSYEAKRMLFSDFKNFTIKEFHRYTSIRPGKKKNGPVVMDLRALRYLPNGDIEFKLDFDDEWRPLPQRKNDKIQGKALWPQLHSQELSIMKDKWKHLQELKSVIPQEYHSFYDSLKCTKK